MISIQNPIGQRFVVYAAISQRYQDTGNNNCKAHYIVSLFDSSLCAFFFRLTAKRIPIAETEAIAIPIPATSHLIRTLKLVWLSDE